jgi:hypothetical protein
MTSKCKSIRVPVSQSDRAGARGNAWAAPVFLQNFQNEWGTWDTGTRGDFNAMEAELSKTIRGGTRAAQH